VLGSVRCAFKVELPMPRQQTFADIVCNALDKDYTFEQAATDLGDLMNERELIKRRYGPGTARLTELECIIPLQEKLALGKLHGDQLFAQLDRLGNRHGQIALNISAIRKPAS
jgi:hypothetical protein